MESPTEADLLNGIKKILVDHFYSNFLEYRRTKGPQRGSTEWSDEAEPGS